MFEREPMHTEPWLLCRSCKYEFKAGVQTFREHFSGGLRACPGCTKTMDWWDEVVHVVTERFQLGRAIELAGAHSVIVTIPLSPGETRAVDLTAAGLPSDAEILYLNLTPQGSGVWPLVDHGNVALPSVLGPKFHVYGRPFHEATERPTVAVWATWFRPKNDSVVMRQLMQAARHFTDGRLEGLIVPANIAVESAVSPVIGKFIEEFASKETSQNFLRDGATYSHQINVLLPMLAKFRGLPPLPEVIRGHLNRLRRLRNDIAHSGGCDALARSDAGVLLAAAIFGVRYVEFVGQGSPGPAVSGQ